MCSFISFFFLYSFTLKKGNVLCSDPASPWTEKAMRKIDEEAEQKRNRTFGLPTDAPLEGTVALPTTTMLPLTSRWPQVHTSVVLMGKHRADSAPKPKRGKKKKIKIVKRKRKGKNKGGKGEKKEQQAASV